MNVNTPTMDDGTFDNKTNNNEQIIGKIYKNHVELPNKVQLEDENIISQENIQDVSSNNLKNNQTNKLFPIEDNRKRRKSKTTLGPKKFYKNIKRVTIDNPFISVVPIESYKKYNLKMTYSEYESVPDSNKIGSICPCQKPLCYIF